MRAKVQTDPMGLNAECHVVVVFFVSLLMPPFEVWKWLPTPVAAFDFLFPCSLLQRKASTSWRFWFPAMRRAPSSGKEVRPSSSCRRRREPPSNCQNPKTSTPVRRRCGWRDGGMDKQTLFPLNHSRFCYLTNQYRRFGLIWTETGRGLCTLCHSCTAVNYKAATAMKQAEICCHSKGQNLLAIR